jgi:hypothetical protein
MLQTVYAVVQDGKIELSEPIELAEGLKVLVTLLPPDEEDVFWLAASQSSLDSVWNNSEDDIYADLRKK